MSTDGSGRLLLLVDPGWVPSTAGERPALERIVGGWELDGDGVLGRFRPNPRHVPDGPGSPTDPVDAVLRLVAAGSAGGDELLAVLPHGELAVALDDQALALVAPAPDGVPSVLVTTAPAYRSRVRAAGWLRVDLDELADALPESGVDVLLNPGAPGSMRLLADAVRHAAGADHRPPDADAESLLAARDMDAILNPPDRST